MSARKKTILIIGDTHCPGMLEGYPEFLWEIYKAWSCDHVVHIGDLVDWHAINFHGRHPETPGVQDEVLEARKQIKQITKIFPKADWLVGNHDALPQRQAEFAGLPRGLLRSEQDFWELPKGWTVHPRWARIEYDGVQYNHGEMGPQGEFAAKSQSKANFQSTVIGHLHANSFIGYTVNHGHRIFGMNVGCGVDHELLQFEYGQKFKFKPVISCGVVVGGDDAYLETMKL